MRSVQNSEGNRRSAALALVALAFMLVTVSGMPAGGEPGSFIKPGQSAPVLTLEKLRGGELRFPAKGHWTIVFFWSLFCHVCIEELPMLAEEVAALPKESVQAVFVSIDTVRMKTGLENFLKKRNLDIEVVLDRVVASASYEAADHWGVRPTPAVFLVNPDGVVTYSCEGPFESCDLFEPLKKAVGHVASQTTVAPVSESIPVVGGEVFVSPSLPPTALSREAVASIAVMELAVTPAGLAMKPVSSLPVAVSASESMSTGRLPALAATPTSHLASYASHGAATSPVPLRGAPADDGALASASGALSASQAAQP